MTTLPPGAGPEAVKTASSVLALVQIVLKGADVEVLQWAAVVFQVPPPPTFTPPPDQYKVVAWTDTVAERSEIKTAMGKIAFFIVRQFMR
jgi:hypothetical protein